jgi:hypothetical protein
MHVTVFVFLIGNVDWSFFCLALRDRLPLHVERSIGPGAFERTDLIDHIGGSGT